MISSTDTKITSLISRMASILKYLLLLYSFILLPCQELLPSEVLWDPVHRTRLGFLRPSSCPVLEEQSLLSSLGALLSSQEPLGLSFSMTRPSSDFAQILRVFNFFPGDSGLEFGLL